MANGYFERGEIYWVRMDNGFGGEQGVGRPGLIVSADSENMKQSTVTIAFMSTKFHATQNYVSVDATGQTSYVICNQIMTYDKNRLGKCLGVLNSEEQRIVDDALERVFDLGYVDDAALKEKDAEIANRNVLIGDLKTEVAGVRAEIGKKDEEIASLKMEIEMWQKCYGRCMDMLVDTKVSADLKRRTVVEPKVGTAAAMVPDLTPEPPVEAPKQPEQPVLEKKIELNSCTETDLRKCGCTEAQARCVKNYGPYTKVEDLLCTPGVTAALFDTLKDKVYCEPPIQDDRLDINTCTATALKKIGFSLSMARKIVESRPYERVEDLKKLNGLKATLYNVLESKLCCVPVVVEQPEPEKKVVGTPKLVEPDPGYERVNVNTATAKELHEVLGLCMATCYSITGRRKKVGPYEKLDDLLGVASITPTSLERLGHLMEV